MKSPIIGVLVPCPADGRLPARGARDVLSALLSRGRPARAIPADRDLGSALRRERVDLAFLALEGRGGDDGTVQAELEAAGVPHTGPAALDAALAGHRARAREVLRRSGLPTPPCYQLPAGLAADEVRERHGDVGYPVLVRSPRRGSSRAAARANDADALVAACARADEELLVERVTPGPRVRIALLDTRPLGAEIVHAFGACRPSPEPARWLDSEHRAELTRAVGAARPGPAAVRCLDLEQLAELTRPVGAARSDTLPARCLELERRLQLTRPVGAAWSDTLPARGLRPERARARRGPTARPSAASVVGSRRLEGILRQASAAARALRLTGPALIEIALDPDANEVVIDADPSPRLARGAPMARITRAAGLRFADLVVAIAAGAAPIDQPLAA